MSENTVCLYFGLHEGKNADLEIVARAALEWANSVRRASKIIEPTSEVRLKFVNAHESSLSINTLIDWGHTGLTWGEKKLEMWQGLPYPLLRNFVLFSALFLAVDGRSTFEQWFGEQKLYESELTEKEQEFIKQLSEKLLESEAIQQSNKKFFNLVGHDSAIRSVGVCRAPGEQPVYTVPSSQFAERSGVFEQVESIIERNAEKTATVLLEVANLTKRDLKWSFRYVDTLEPFNAKMRDDEFIERVANGEINETLRGGIQMDVTIKFREAIEDGKWVAIPTSFEITKVTL